MRIIEELNKKISTIDNYYAIMGAEIRLRRNLQSKTLKLISKDTCSVSYLSKIENAEIKPNPQMLEEICKRLKISKENMDTISNSKSIYENAIKGLFLGDTTPLNEAYEQTMNLKNYRAKLIYFLYVVVNDDIKTAARIYKELDKLVSAMMLNDLIILSYIETLYFYKLGYFEDANKLINEIESINLPFPYVNDVILKLKVEVLYTINSNLYLTYAERLKGRYLKYESYDNVGKVNKQIKSFYIKNGYFSELNLNEDNESDHDALLYSELYRGQNAQFRSGYSVFAKFLYYSKTDLDIFKKMYEENINLLSEKERLIIDIIYAMYYDDAYYNTILDIYYPNALSTNDEVLIESVEDFVVNALIKKQRYRRIIDIFTNCSSRRRKWA